MSDKTFMTISREECLIVYKDLLDNSNKRWKSGKILSQSGDYGLAISMSIISIEEMIKSIIIILDGKGFEFRNVKGMDTFFRDHQIRYLIAYLMFVISLAGDEF